MRVLVSIAPRSYREALARALRQERPHAEVKPADPNDLDQEVGRFEPHLVVCNGVTLKVRETARSWVHILYEDSLDARISVGGRESKMEDIGVDDLLTIIDETEKLISGG
ncbi:MAG TPA: hypothetical protein VFE09_05200 [Rubrobacteraceae bacterium]|nr:hypothetical protein [Rubrobacteraceae bacterium]